MTHAVRLQERLDEVAVRRVATAPPEATPAPPQVPAAPRVLTGIERTLIEQRLAAERAAALAAAEAERADAAAAVHEPMPPEPPSLPETEPGPVAHPAPGVASARVRARRAGRRRERARWQRPAWLSVPGPATVTAAAPVALPLIGAAIAWIAITVSGRPVLPLDESRILLAALALVGPAGAIGGLIARTWYPRLGGLVMASSVAALAMLTRTILA